MLDQVPFGVSVLFMITALVTSGFFIASVMTASSQTVRRRAHPLALILLMWMIFQSTLALNGWYMDRKSVPPNLLFPFATSASIFILLFVIPAGRRFLNGVNTGTLTLLHVVRIPVEIGLFILATWKQVPWSMTFAGYNFDILAGLTAPLIWWLGYHKRILSPRIVIAWNAAALILLLIIVVTAAGALPSPIQAWDFNQPNYAVMHFPFIWLPSVIVPLVLFSHIASIYQMSKQIQSGH